jgi:predicted GIY-YIG superfamily endonuclease
VTAVSEKRRLPAVGLAEEGIRVSLADVHYVYLIESQSDSRRHYVGFTHNLKARLASHNAGRNQSTAVGRAWNLVSYFAFANERTAIEFEKYLKSGSGKTFLLRHLL